MIDATGRNIINDIFKRFGEKNVTEQTTKEMLEEAYEAGQQSIKMWPEYQHIKAYTQEEMDKAVCMAKEESMKQAVEAWQKYRDLKNLLVALTKMVSGDS